MIASEVLAAAPPQSETWPSADTIKRGCEHAQALVECPSRARLIAFDALHTLYPGFGATRLGLRLGFNQPSRAGDLVSKAKLRDWWSDCLVDEVIGCLVAPQYGERAL